MPTTLTGETKSVTETATKKNPTDVAALNASPLLSYLPCPLEGSYPFTAGLTIEFYSGEISHYRLPGAQTYKLPLGSLP